MPIFKDTSGALKKLNTLPLDKEKNLQKLVEDNLMEVLELHFLATEYVTTFGGRIDTLAVDVNGAPVRHPLVTTDFADSVLANSRLPEASELLDNLLLNVASELPAPGEKLNLKAHSWRAVLGALSSSGVRWAIEQAIGRGLLEGKVAPSVVADDHFQVIHATLTVDGWARVEALLREAKDSRKAFMAMKFGDPELDVVFKDHFKRAVQQTGFNLQRLDEEPRAGLIDDRMRLEIRTSRILIADLTHGNAGAYWEAGYAEGLGRPVIYTCRKDVFDDEKKRPHFDTNHHLTVIWDPAALGEAMMQLKTVIRVTLPAEAVLEDESL